MNGYTAIVIPVFNEAEGISGVLRNIEECLTTPIYFILVNDGSTDLTAENLRDYKVGSPNRKRVVNLSRNFGHHPAIMTGLTQVPKGVDAIVVMDSDGQDAPEDLTTLLSKLKQGFDCVYAVRQPESNSRLINLCTRIFYRVQDLVMSFPIPRYAGTYSAFNGRFLEQLLAFSEIEVFFPGLRAYVGLRQVGVSVTRRKRQFGTSRVGIIGLLRLSSTGLLGFSPAPMRLIFILGIGLVGFCIIFGILLIILRLTGVVTVMGFTILALLILFVLGVQAVFIGLVGEYIGKLFIESKRRSRAIISDISDE